MFMNMFDSAGAVTLENENDTFMLVDLSDFAGAATFENGSVFFPTGAA